MKKLLYLSLTLGIAISSCQDMLDEDIRNQISNEHLNTALGLEDGVNATYSYLRNFYGIQNGGFQTVYGTDEFTSGGADPAFNAYTANINSGSGTISGPWNAFYEAINACNAVIGRAAHVPGITEQHRNMRIGEARFMRAFYYYLLVELYGPLHITLQETQGPSTTANRSPIELVYKVLIDDLDFAVAHLPLSTSQPGRATLPAAKHLLARVYLTRAATPAAESSDYAKAAVLAKQVIETPGGPALLDDFGDIYRIGNEVNKEVIFSVQYSSNVLTNGNGNNAHMFFICGYEGQPGMYRDLVNGRPWAHYKPNEYLLNLFSKQDSRNEKTFQRVWYCNKPGTYLINGKSVTLAAGDTSFYLSPREVTPAERARANYRIYSPSEYTNGIFPSLKKYLDPNRPSINEAKGTRDFVLFRLADTYLLAAEALVMDGKAQEALPYINTVRRRAARTGATAAETDANRKSMEVTAAELDLDFILDERSRELAGEYMRWIDLKRTNKLIERVKKYNPQAAPNIQQFHQLRPIPQTQIDRTEGGATAFPQNPGYN